jgi:hypothetical protein
MMKRSKKKRLIEEVQRIHSETSGELEFRFIYDFDVETLAGLGALVTFEKPLDRVLLFCKGVTPKRWRDTDLDFPSLVF